MRSRLPLPRARCSTLPRRAVERAADQAEVLRLFDLAELRATLDAHDRRPGAPVLRAVLEDHRAGTTVTRSELEERFLCLCDESGIERPRVTARVAGLEVR
jgi:hypothetical protein